MDAVDELEHGRDSSAGRAWADAYTSLRPTERSHDNLHRRCTADLDSLRDRMDGGWERFQEYALDRMRTPSVKAAVRALMGQLGVPAIPPADLARITGDVPALEQPEAFLRALRHSSGVKR